MYVCVLVVAWLNKRENDHLLERGSRHALHLSHHAPAFSGVHSGPSFTSGTTGTGINTLSSIRPPAATVGSGISSPQPPQAPNYPPITSYAGMQLHSKVCKSIKYRVHYLMRCCGTVQGKLSISEL